MKQLVAASLAVLALGVSEAAERVFVGEHIVTMDGAPVTALATDGEKIVWRGNAEAATRWIDDATEVIELGDRALLPGFIDAHGHVTFLAITTRLANVASPPVGPVRDLAGLAATLSDYIEARAPEPDEWVVGIGYDDSLLAERRHPTRADLDAISAEHPIALMHVSGHLLTANSKALAYAGIAAETEDPAGGHIRRDADGEPNGVLEETATYALRGKMLAPSADPAADMAAALAIYAQHGITTAQDGATAAEAIDFLRGLDAAGKLSLDVIAYPVLGTDEIPDHPYGQYGERFKVGGVKLVLDGSPQGKTAYLSEPYHVPPAGKGADYRGYPTFDEATVDRFVKGILGARVPLLAHANGDAAADLLIHAVRRAVGETRPDHRTVMIHAQTVREDQLDAMNDLGMIPSFFSAHTFYWGDWHRDSVLGTERASRISPTRSAVAREMPFTVHNDAPIVPPDMVRLLWATTNRETRSSQVLGEAQRISIEDALRAITVHAAYQAFEEDRKGTLAPGKQADLVVLSTNPLNMDAADLLSLDVIATYSRGREVYRRGE